MAHLDTKVAQLCPTLCDPMDYTMPQLEKNLPAMQDTWVRSLGWEDPLEKGKATHSSILAMENSMGYIDHGVTKSWTRQSDFHFQG